LYQIFVKKNRRGVSNCLKNLYTNKHAAEILIAASGNPKRPRKPKGVISFSFLQLFLWLFSSPFVNHPAFSIYGISMTDT
jgi:hypothetical protein